MNVIGSIPVGPTKKDNRFELPTGVLEAVFLYPGFAESASASASKRTKVLPVLGKPLGPIIISTCDTCCMRVHVFQSAR